MPPKGYVDNCYAMLFHPFHLHGVSALISRVIKKVFIQIFSLSSSIIKRSSGYSASVELKFAGK